MNRLIEKNWDEERNQLNITSILAELCGSLSAHAECLEDKEGFKLPRKYYADELRGISSNLKEVWHFMHDKDKYIV